MIGMKALNSVLRTSDCTDLGSRFRLQDNSWRRLVDGGGKSLEGIRFRPGATDGRWSVRCIICWINGSGQGQARKRKQPTVSPSPKD
jgi:hypothetical protein